MESLKRMRLLTVRLTLLITGIAAIVAYAISVPAMKGVLAGGMTGALAFWIIARQMARVATLDKDAIQFRVYRWTFLRLGLYGVALVWAMMLDRESMHGLIGAAIGIFISHAVLIFIGITGLDLKQETQSNGTHR